MGWARYAHSMRVFVINSGLFYIRPTLASVDLMDRITHRLDTENGWDQAIFNEVSYLVFWRNSSHQMYPVNTQASLYSSWSPASGSSRPYIGCGPICCQWMPYSGPVRMRRACRRYFSPQGRGTVTPQ